MVPDTYKPLVKFLLIGFSCYVAWITGYEVYFQKNTIFDQYLIQLETNIAVVILNIFGFTTEGEYVSAYKQGVITFGNRGILGIASACNGLSLIVVFLIFLWAFPGSVKSKLSFSLIGVLSIFMVNIIRIVALSAIFYYQPQSLQFNHKYVFTFAVYLFIFYLWRYWVKNYSSYAKLPSVK